MSDTRYVGKGEVKKNPVRFLIAEPQSLVRQGLRGIVSQVPSYSVVGETGDAAAVVELGAQLEPEIVFLAVEFPGRCGMELLTALRRKKRRVLMLADGEDDKNLRHALKCGAAGYLLKSVTAEELHLAIRTILRGYRYLSVELADRLISEYSGGAREPATPSGQAAANMGSAAAADAAADEIPLTCRQREVLRLMASGLGNHQIGSKLGISPRTVETHRAGIMQKLGLTTAYAAVRYALQRGLISLDE